MDITKTIIGNKPISITNLELLAAAADVVLVCKCGLFPTEHQIALRRDNTTACGAVIDGAAYSTYMRFLSSIFTGTCSRYGLRCLVLHISTAENRIAEFYSRNEWEAAKETLRGL